jgi:hypothetical protein
MKGGLAMGRKVEVIDLGDAIVETRQSAPFGTYPDNVMVWSQWY